MESQADSGLFAGLDDEEEEHGGEERIHAEEKIEGPFRCPGCGLIKTHEMYSFGWHSCDTARCYTDWSEERAARGLPVRTDKGEVVVEGEKVCVREKRENSVSVN